MRSTTRFRLQQCRSVAAVEPAPLGFGKPVLRLRSPAMRRLDLREQRAALKRLITGMQPVAPVDPGLDDLAERWAQWCATARSLRPVPPLLAALSAG